IRSLADTLEDRAIVVPLQRKPKNADVARLRRRDNGEFAAIRRQAARWARDNHSKSTDPRVRSESSKREQKHPTEHPTALCCSDLFSRKIPRYQLAGGLGFEPRFSESESDVLPLNYPPI